MVRLGLKPSPPYAAAVTTVVTLMAPTHADYSRVVVFRGGRSGCRRPTSHVGIQCQ